MRAPLDVRVQLLEKGIDIAAAASLVDSLGCFDVRPRHRLSRNVRSWHIANQNQLPLKKCSTRSVSMTLGRSLGIGPVGLMGNASARPPPRTTKASAHHQTLPPTRRVFG